MEHCRSATGMPQSFTPTHLALDWHGNVLVAEFTGNAVQLYDIELRYRGDVVPRASGLQEPFRLCLDHTSEQLYVGEYSRGGRVLVFDKSTQLLR